MKVLIVAPKVTAKPGDFYLFPLGLGYITSTLKSVGHEVKVLNTNLFDEDPAPLVERTVREFGADAVATGSLSAFLPKVREIFSAARRAKPEIINIAGGGVLSSDPEAGPSVMDIDVGVIGEGEATVVDLCDALERGRDLRTVPGIVFVDHGASSPAGLRALGLTSPLHGGAVVRTASRDAVDDLGSIPWPDYDAFGYDFFIDRQRTYNAYIYHEFDRPRAIEMVTSRSCPYRCTFCFHPSGKVYRDRPLDDIFAELDFLSKRYHINAVAFVDELFSLKKKRLFEFCERIKPYNLAWTVQLHVNIADDQVLDALIDSGCNYISYGVESMSPEVLLSMQKGSRVERIDDVMRRTYERTIGIQGNLIFGDTAETLETANESMHWWATHRAYMVNSTRLQVYPGSPDYIEAVRDGLITNRAEFIDKLDIDLNISRMNDANLRMISLLSGTAQKALLRVAPVVSFEDDLDEFFPLSYRIVWDCPRCDHRSDYRNVIPTNADRRAFLLSCRNCRARYYVENLKRAALHQRPTYAADRRVYREAMVLMEAGERERAAEMLHALVKGSVWFHPAQSALARYYRARCAASTEPETADKMGVIMHAGLAVLENPFEPLLHVEFAEHLAWLGAFGMARLHLEQALHLDPAFAPALEALRAHDALDLTEQQKAWYFPSFSDAPPPQRVQPPGYVRPKREHEFPDIAAIEREVRERMAGAAV